VSSFEPTLSVSTRVEYSALAKGSRQDVFGLVTVTAAEAPEEDDGGRPGSTDAEGEREPMDIVFVLDVSGSMNGEKIQLLKDAVRFVVEDAQPKDRVSLVTFNHAAARHLRLRRMSAEGKDEAIVTTLKLAAGGGTCIAAGLEVGVSVIEGRRSRNKVSAVLLLTDGRDGGSQGRIPELITRCRQANCSLYCFGFGSDHDAALLASMAEQAMTPFTFVEGVAQIRETFAGTIGGLSSVVAQGIELSLTCRAVLKEVHTPFTVQRASEQEATVMIPDIFAGEKRDILVELDVPIHSTAEEVEGAAAAQPTSVLLQAVAKYTDLRRNVVLQTPVVAMTAERPEEPQPELEPDEEVTAQRERVEVARTLREAAERGDRYDFDGAQQLIETQANALKAKKTRSKLSPGLLTELEGAAGRMASRSSWEQGGRAQLRDNMQMHSWQRSTNLAGASCMQDMYVNKMSKMKIGKSKGG